MKFTVERIYNGYLITDLQPHGEIRQHVSTFLEVLKKLGNCAYLANCPDVQPSGFGEFKHQFLEHSADGWNTPKTGFQYGILDPERWEAPHQKLKRELNNFSGQGMRTRPHTSNQGVRKSEPEASEGWTSYKWHPEQDTEVTMVRKHFLVPKKEFEELQRKAADIKKNKKS